LNTLISYFITMIGITIMAFLFAIQIITLSSLLISIPIFFFVGFMFHMYFEKKIKQKGFIKTCYGCLDTHRIPKDIDLFLCSKCKGKK